MPLFIPVILGGVALASGGVGVKKGIDARKRQRDAKTLVEGAKRRHKAQQRAVERAREALATRMAEYYKRREAIRNGLFAEVASLLEQLRHVRKDRGEGLVELLVDPTDGAAALPSFSGESLSFRDLADGIGKSVLMGAGTSAAATSAATSIGVASTGAAISGLSGAAANSAMMAWLGGGALSAGGFGMAGGAVVLGGIAVGPALAVGGFALTAKAERAYTQAQEFAADTARKSAQLATLVQLHRDGISRVNEYAGVVDGLAGRASTELQAAQEFLADDAVETSEFENSFRKLMLLVRGISDLLRGQVLDENLSRPQRTNDALRHGRELLE